MENFKAIPFHHGEQKVLLTLAHGTTIFLRIQRVGRVKEQTALRQSPGSKKRGVLRMEQRTGLTESATADRELAAADSRRSGAHETAPEPFFPEKFFFGVAAVVTVVGFISFVFCISFRGLSSGLFMAFHAQENRWCILGLRLVQFVCEKLKQTFLIDMTYKGEFLAVQAPCRLRFFFCCSTCPYWVSPSFFSVPNMSLVPTARLERVPCRRVRENNGEHLVVRENSRSHDVHHLPPHQKTRTRWSITWWQCEKCREQDSMSVLGNASARRATRVAVDVALARKNIVPANK